MVERDEHVAAPVRAVLEHLVGRQMAPPDADARQIGRHQSDRDAALDRSTQEAIGIAELEGQAQHGRDRTQRDVALVPVQPDAQHLGVAKAAAADDAAIGHGGGIGAGFGAGQAEGRDVPAVGQARQPMALLRLGAELQQQLARPQRVRHHDRDRGRDRAGRHGADHFRMGEGGKAKPAIAFRDDHAEEALGLDEPPDLGRQIAQLPIDPPVVEHGAELLDRAVDEGLLGRGQLRRRRRQELAPVRMSGEQRRIPPDIAGRERLALGRRQAGQRGLGPAEDRPRQVVSAPRCKGHGSPVR